MNTPRKGKDDRPWEEDEPAREPKRPEQTPPATPPPTPPPPPAEPQPVDEEETP